MFGTHAILICKPLDSWWCWLWSSGFFDCMYVCVPLKISVENCPPSHILTHMHDYDCAVSSFDDNDNNNKMKGTGKAGLGKKEQLPICLLMLYY